MHVMAEGIKAALADGGDLSGTSIKEALETMVRSTLAASWAPARSNSRRTHSTSYYSYCI